MPRFFLDKQGRDIEIRTVTPADVDRFLIFQPQVARESNFTLQRVDDPPSRETVLKRWDWYSQNLRDCLFCAFHNEKMVAHTGMQTEYSGHPWTKHSGEFGMMVVKEFWGGGLANAMMKRMEEHARASGFRRLGGRVRENNPRGIAFYKKCGFEIEGRRKCAAIIDGVEIDEFYIAKLL